jgi:hypothetical protein
LHAVFEPFEVFLFEDAPEPLKGEGDLFTCPAGVGLHECFHHVLLDHTYLTNLRSDHSHHILFNSEKDRTIANTLPNTQGIDLLVIHKRSCLSIDNHIEIRIVVILGDNCISRGEVLDFHHS